MKRDEVSLPSQLKASLGEGRCCVATQSFLPPAPKFLPGAADRI